MEYIISTASDFYRIGVGLQTKDRNPTSWILPQILPWELLRLQICCRVSTLPAWQQKRMCTHVSCARVQLGHFRITDLSHSIDLAIPITCLLAHSWNSFRTFLNVLYTISQSTISKVLWWKICSPSNLSLASFWCAHNLKKSASSVVTLLSPARTQTGSNRHGFCFGSSVGLIFHRTTLAWCPWYSSVVMVLTGFCTPSCHLDGHWHVSKFYYMKLPCNWSGYSWGRLNVASQLGCMLNEDL